MAVKLSSLSLIVYDFDGVMTDNKVYIDSDGRETVRVDRADGLSISEIKKLNIDQIIISTEKNPVVSARASKLNILCFQGVSDKKTVLLNYCKKNGFDIKNTVYIGNDINDLEVLKCVGVSMCPSDAHKSVKVVSKHVLKAKGGSGVVRELLYLVTNNGE